MISPWFNRLEFANLFTTPPPLTWFVHGRLDAVPVQTNMYRGFRRIDSDGTTPRCRQCVLAELLHMLNICLVLSFPRMSSLLNHSLIGVVNQVPRIRTVHCLYPNAGCQV